MTKVWEVYEHNSQWCIIFKNKELAENQTVFDESDIIDTAYVCLSNNELHILKDDGHILV